jgi:ribonuclease HI
MNLEIYTDGSALPTNPGHGGAASVILYDDRIVLIAKYLGNFVTSIQAELLAIERALRHCTSNFNPESAVLYSDSKYSLMSIAGQYRSTLSLPRTKRIRDLMIAPELNKKLSLKRIAAHKELSEATSDEEKKAIYWNSVVDVIAKKAARDGEGYFFKKDMPLIEFQRDFIKIKKD